MSQFSIYYSGFGWYGSLAELTPNSAYKIKLSNPATATFTGAPVSLADTRLSLANGWNWLPYLRQVHARALLPTSMHMRMLTRTCNTVRRRPLPSAPVCRSTPAVTCRAIASSRSHRLRRSTTTASPAAALYTRTSRARAVLNCHVYRRPLSLANALWLCLLPRLAMILER